MKRNIVTCPALNISVNKDERCPDWTCEDCPALPRKAPKDTNHDMPENPVDLAANYLNNKLPKFSSYFNVKLEETELYRDRFILNSIATLNIKSTIENRLYKALYEFNEVIRNSKDSPVRKKNVKTMSRKKEKTSLSI